MATGKVLNAANSSFSLSGGFQSIFSCCFATPAPTTNRGKEGEDSKNEEAADGVLVRKGREGADGGADTGAKGVREEGRLAGGAEEVSQARRNRSPSEQDSAVYDEFRDSAIDSGSLTSQFNLRGNHPSFMHLPHSSSVCELPHWHYIKCLKIYKHTTSINACRIHTHITFNKY